jgi:16S rRNA (cytosine967-C5)-methyltransferase
MPDGYQPSDDPLFLAGERTAQDPSETMVGWLAPESDGLRLLDLCAAPGTKTSHLGERFPGARIFAMDRSRSRAQRLRETLARTGIAAQIVLGDAGAPPFRQGTADGVLLDAPCSALGVLRRRVDARWNVLEPDLARHHRQQGRLLEEAARLVAPGGWLLYSVCTVEPEETDQVRAAFLERCPAFRPEAFPLELPAEVRGDEGELRILPGQLDCDGVYASLFRCSGNPS